MRLWPGSPCPLGATWDGMGVNFAMYSEHGSRVELCLFDSVDARTEQARVELCEPNDVVREFKTMVRALHSVGIEVILDVVMDSLRYWIQEMHVDGFRFDLASALARELHEVNQLAGFFDAIHQDPVISQVKLIAEPWDLGEGGYQVGNFPVGWTEWNGKYRDSVRRFWRGDGGQLSEFATRLSGSSDLYERSGRRPYASINFITAHDGFTLHDLVSYDRKHNEANKEDNRDGTDDNLSWNGGVEGPTDDPAVNALRERQQRNLMMTLLLSQGVPMIRGGDELGQTQRGNNNAYCQDNEVSWLQWDLTPAQQAFLEFTRHMIACRRTQPVLRRRKFFQGRSIRGAGIKDISWFAPDGREMTDEAWNASLVRSLGVRLADTANGVSTPTPLHGGDRYEVRERSMTVFRLSVPKRRRRTDRAAAHAASRVREPAETVGAGALPVPDARPAPSGEPQPAGAAEQWSDEPAIAR